ncbi:hypothetical protein FB567DRAFT_306720 [Paraphoma chrysanthemicola]|uniref:F-box domain-containing protein n=1 Tax=Paraphoma chrysanthemicola TaxID=798071 RepID=A0A8K0R9F2_9PLEO|nr:hypothetical protein FB567DRAFT_306720 [Paraphoma chrysanthemicola]
MVRHRRRHAQPRFPFLDLPADLQMLVMSNADIHTLQNLTYASPHTMSLYRSHPTGILQGAVATMEPQFRYLLLTTYSLVCAIRHEDPSNNALIGNVEAFLKDRLDTEDHRPIELVDHDALGALYMLCTIDADVSIVTQNYAETIYERAYHYWNPGVVLPPLLLSPVERYRMTRAVYRLRLFQVLYHDYPDRFEPDFEDPEGYPDFSERLSAFELDEMGSVYAFARQSRPEHGGCTFIDHWPWRTITPFECQKCQSTSLYDTDLITALTAARPSAHSRRSVVQPFSNILDGQQTGRHKPWADPKSWRQFPIKIWPTHPEVHRPSIGWMHWFPSRGSDANSTSATVYAEQFQRFGHCFWDAERCAEWGGMFSPIWRFEFGLREEEEAERGQGGIVYAEWDGELELFI